MSKRIYKDLYQYDPIVVPNLLKSSKTHDVLDGLWYTVHGLQEYEPTSNTIKQLLIHKEEEVRESAFSAIAHLIRIHGCFDFSFLEFMNKKFESDDEWEQDDAREVFEDLYIFFHTGQINYRETDTLSRAVKEILDFKSHQDFNQIAHLENTQYPCVAFLMVKAAGSSEIASYLTDVSNYTTLAFSHPVVQNQLELIQYLK